jgi:hypothetical protein
MRPNKIRSFRRNLLPCAFIFLMAIFILPRYPRCQACNCSNINLFQISPAPPASAVPCPDPTGGDCSPCVCSYLEMWNSTACCIDSIKISAPSGSCVNYCGWLKDEYPPPPSYPYNGIWAVSPAQPSTCSSNSSSAMFIPQSGGDQFCQSPSYKSKFIIKICGNSVPLTYTITFYFDDGSSCTKNISTT